MFTKDDKLRIAEALAEAGVPRIEAGPPGGLAGGRRCRPRDGEDGAAVEDLRVLAVHRRRREARRRLRGRRGRDGDPLEPPPRGEGVPLARAAGDRRIRRGDEPGARAGAHGLVLPDRRDARGAGGVPRPARARRDRRARRRGGTGRHLRRAVAPRCPDVRPADSRTDGRATGDALPHGLRPRRSEHAARGRGGRRGDPDHGHRDRRTGRQHADGGDGPGAPDDVWTRCGDQDRALLRAVEARDGARGRRRSRRTGRSSASGCTTSSPGSSRRGSATSGTS